VNEAKTWCAQVSFRGNRAGLAGGGLFIDCPSISQTCNPVLNAKLGLPKLAQHVVMTEANKAGGYGDDIAQAPVLLTVTNASTHYVPGRTRDVLRMAVGLQDERGHRVKGSATLENPYRIRLRFCSPSPEAAQSTCSSNTALQPDVILPLDAVDTFTDITVFSVFLHQCLVGINQVAVHVSVDQDLSVEKDGLRSVIMVECLPCGEGESRVESTNAGRQFHTCQPCGNSEYVVENNDAAVTCQRCPSKGGPSPPLPQVSLFLLTPPPYELTRCNVRWQQAARAGGGIAVAKKWVIHEAGFVPGWLHSSARPRSTGVGRMCAVSCRKILHQEGDVFGVR